MSNYDDWKCNPPEPSRLIEDEDGRVYRLPYGIELDPIEEELDQLANIKTAQEYHLQGCRDELARQWVAYVESGLRDYVLEFWSEIVDFDQTPSVTVQHFLQEG